jgi:DNA-binding transcriptional regulator YiaG
MKKKFSKTLNEYKKELNVTQSELCALLYDVPHRTIQSWLQGEKEPSKYVQSLILFKLESQRLHR